jgi:hypothetical protein
MIFDLTSKRKFTEIFYNKKTFYCKIIPVGNNTWMDVAIYQTKIFKIFNISIHYNSLIYTDKSDAWRTTNDPDVLVSRFKKSIDRFFETQSTIPRSVVIENNGTWFNNEDILSYTQFLRKNEY